MDSFGPFSLEKQAGKNPPKNPQKNPRFSRELFDQDPLRENSALRYCRLGKTEGPPYLRRLGLSRSVTQNEKKIAQK